MILLETERLTLRNVISRDAETMYDYRNNEICARYQRGQTQDYDGITALVEKRKNDVISTDSPFMIAVALKSSNDMVGEIVVMPNDGTISLGYTFSYKHHRKGYAFEAAYAFFDYLFNQKGARRIYAYTEDYNISSQKLCIKLGMRKEGIFKEFVSFVNDDEGNPIYENTIQWAILKKEWLDNSILSSDL